MAAALFLSGLEVEDPADSDDDDDGGNGKGGGGGRRAIAGSVDEDGDEIVAEFGADAESDNAGSEHGGGGEFIARAPTVVPCVLPAAAVVVPPAAFLVPAPASLRTHGAFAQLWRSLPFARFAEASLAAGPAGRTTAAWRTTAESAGPAAAVEVVEGSAADAARLFSGGAFLGALHPSARAALPFDGAYSDGASVDGNADVTAVRAVSRRWRGGGEAAFLWRHAPSQQWVAVLVRGLRTRPSPPRPATVAGAAAASGATGAAGAASNAPTATAAPTAGARPMLDVLADVKFASNVAEATPHAQAVAAAVSMHALEDAVVAAGAATLRDQLLLVAKHLGIPTTIPKTTPATASAAGAPLAAVAGTEAGTSSSAAAVAPPPAVPPSAAPSVAPPAAWVFEVETRSGDLSLLHALDAPLAPATAAATTVSTFPRRGGSPWLSFLGGGLLGGRTDEATVGGAEALQGGRARAPLSLAGTEPVADAAELLRLVLPTAPSSSSSPSVAAASSAAGGDGSVQPVATATRLVLPAWRTLQAERVRRGLVRPINPLPE